MMLDSLNTIPPSAIALGGAVICGLVSSFFAGTWLSASRYRKGISLVTSAVVEDAHAKFPQALSELQTGVPALDRELKEAVFTLIEKMSLQEEECRWIFDRYRILTENLAAAVVIRDQENKITYCSPYTEVLTGYGLSEIYDAEGDFFLNVVHNDDKETYRRAVMVSSVGEPFQYRCRYLHKTGIEMWGETRTVPILDEDENVISSLSITIDVTGAVRYQRQVEEKNRDLQDFTYMVSHDLKAPIFTIKGMTSIIEEDFAYTLPQELREIIEHISSAAHRLETLVAGVLEYSRISGQESASEPVNIGTVLEDVCKDHAAMIEKTGAKITNTASSTVVLGDGLRLSQVFSNLIGNSLKYRAHDRTPRITISTEPGTAHRTVNVRVKDNGLGIPRDKIHEIFRPFVRAHGNEIEGTGIGLATVKRLLEKLSGEISVESTEGEGSEFTVTLRAAP